MTQAGNAQAATTPTTRLYSFKGGDHGAWRIVSMTALLGPALQEAACLTVEAGATTPGARWALRGVTSNERYVTRAERSDLVARQQGLGRPEAVCAALIPIRKSAAWWALTQDERREIFEARSHHIQLGMAALPGVARRLHHCRDLGADEPFDFLTWFEYAPADAPAFDELLAALRATHEWTYVEREVDLRLTRAPG